MNKASPDEWEERDRLALLVRAKFLDPRYLSAVEAYKSLSLEVQHRYRNDFRAYVEYAERDEFDLAVITCWPFVQECYPSPKPRTYV